MRERERERYFVILRQEKERKRKVQAGGWVGLGYGLGFFNKKNIILIWSGKLGIHPTKNMKPMTCSKPK